MSRRLIIRGKAKLDLAQAVLWYHRRRSGLGDELLASVRSQMEEIMNRPAAFPIVEKQDIRRALIDRFPYAIYFVERPEFVAVLAILHTSRDARSGLRGR